MRCSQPRTGDEDILRGSYLLRGAEPQLACGILQDRRGECFSFDGGEFLHQPGQRRHFAGILLGGKAQLTFYEGDRAVNLLKTGQFFGITSLHSPSGEFPASVRASGRCRALFLPKELIDELLHRDETVLHNHLSFLSGRIHNLNRRLQGTSSDAAAQLALYLADMMPADGNTFTLPYGMTTLAAALGISRASLYRAMDELTRLELIHREGRKISVPNALALRTYINTKRSNQV